MSCSNRRNKFRTDLAVVRVLAQQTANLTDVAQIIYKTICDGVTIFKFSTDWKGQAIETVNPITTVQFDRDDTSESVLQDNEREQPTDVRTELRHNNKRKNSKRDLE